MVRGQKAPIVGRVCMDQMMVDVTDIENVTRADIVTLIGKDGDAEITVEKSRTGMVHLIMNLSAIWVSGFHAAII